VEEAGLFSAEPPNGELLLGPPNTEGLLAPLLNTEGAVEATLPKAGAADDAAPPKIDPVADEESLLPPNIDPPVVECAVLVTVEPKRDSVDVAADVAETGVTVVEPPKIELGTAEEVATGVTVVEVPKMEPAVAVEVEPGVTVAAALLPPNIESLAEVNEVTAAVELVVDVAAPPNIEPPVVALFPPKNDDATVEAALAAPLPPNMEPPAELVPPKMDFGLSSVAADEAGFEPPPNREDDPELAGWENIDPPELEPPPNRELEVDTGVSADLGFSG